MNGKEVNLEWLNKYFGKTSTGYSVSEDKKTVTVKFTDNTEKRISEVIFYQLTGVTL